MLRYASQTILALGAHPVLHETAHLLNSPRDTRLFRRSLPKIIKLQTTKVAAIELSPEGVEKDTQKALKGRFDLGLF